MKDIFPEKQTLESSQKNDKDDENINSSSPKNSKNFDFNYLISSPEKNKMNQKFFPSKENYFGTKLSPINNYRPLSPKAHSPILNYYIDLSPPAIDYNNYYSPKRDNVIKSSKNNFKKLSPNFNVSPSDFFNKDINNGKEINEDDSQTLKEKMEPFINMQNMNLSDNEKNENEDDNDENEDGENFVLSFQEEEKKENTEINKINNNININNNNDENNTKNTNTNNDSKINPNNNEINIKQNLSESDELVKNIINKSDYTPYIPNQIRNAQNNMNYYYQTNNENYMDNNYNYQNYNYMKYPQNFNNMVNNNINSLSLNDSMNYINNFESQSQNFYYNGDNYQINTAKEYKKKDYTKFGQIPSITPEDVVTTITSNNKVIKRINPNVYLNESVEFLAHNISILAQDQAGCRYLQETVEKNPEKTVKTFFIAMIPNLVTLIRDPFGNYFVQKLFPYLSPDDIKIILENIEHNIFDLGSNHHGTRVVQNLINYLNTPELADLFLKIIKPYIISLLKEMHGTHIINKFLLKFPKYMGEINKVILDNCCSLATHKHGCCFLQKILETPNNPLKHELIKNLLDNCLILVIDQYGNYVIQSILFLNNYKYSSQITLILSDNVEYFSKHKYSSNVIEKCFDFCGKREKNILIEKLCNPEIISELILDEHGNYVIQKALYYADYEKKEEMFKTLNPLIPKIKNTPFGEKLLLRLYSIYPKLYNKNSKEERNNNKYQKNQKNNMNNGKDKNNNFYLNNSNNYQVKNNYNNNYINKFNNINNENNINKNNNKYELINNDINNNTQGINNNVSLNNYYNINNNTFNINFGSNNDDNENNINNISNQNNNIMDEDKKFDEIEKNNNNIHDEVKKKKKKKKGKKKKTNNDETKPENVSNSFNNNENIEQI